MTVSREDRAAEIALEEARENVKRISAEIKRHKQDKQDKPK